MHTLKLTRPRLRGAALIALLLGVLVSTAGLAQVATGNIDVTVVDADGAVLPGVTVSVRNEATGAERIGITDALGVARFPALPPGVYQVSANLEGFKPGEKDVTLRVGQTVRLTLTLSIDAVSETLTVVADVPLVDVFKTDASTNIVPEQIEELPVADRDFQRLAFIAPGVQRERGTFRFIQGGPVIGSGGNASQSTILVDGVDFTDQALGLARTRFSQDAIREFRVITNRFDAEIGGSAGGALSVITKSGGNDFKGSVFGFWRDDSLRSAGELEQGDLPFERTQFGLTVGGPIRADKTHFFGSLETINQDAIALFRPGGAFAGLAEDVAHPTDQLLGLLSFNHQLSAGANLDAKLVYEEYREENFRVGGVSAVSNGQELNRDNWNAALGYTRVIGSGGSLNEARFQFGARKYDEPTNSSDLEEWFSGGNTLRIGNNTVGDLLGDGDYWEVRDTFHWTRGKHDLKAGGAVFHVEERSIIDVFQDGLLIYLTDDRSLPLAYAYGIGSSDVSVDTDLLSVFFEDQVRVSDRLSLTLGLRYDYDTDGNNPDFEIFGERSVDDDNFQPRVAFSYDLSGDGTRVLRGGAGIFTGRYLLVPSFTELQQNGVTGRLVRQNLNGLLLGLPPAFWLNPADPENTGIPLPPDVSRLANSLEAPEQLQVSFGVTQRLGQTGLYFDAEVIYADGDNEIVIRDVNFGGNANPVRLNPFLNQINTYTNEGRSEYSALVLAVNGTVGKGHLVTANVTFADKKNIADDFSPAFPTGYPSDPFNIDAEYGPSRGAEDVRVVLTGIFRLPWGLSLAPIFEYGSGQPWNHILGYDANGDGKNSDRPAGVGRNSEDGPSFRSLSLRLQKTVALGGDKSLDLIVEGFNVFDSTNFDVSSVNNAEFLARGVPNPNFGTYRATLSPREIQVGARFRF